MPPKSTYYFRFAVILVVSMTVVYLGMLSTSTSVSPWPIKFVPMFSGPVRHDGDVERRLAEANVNWLKGLEKRKKYFEDLLHPENNRVSQKSPWDYFIKHWISMWDFIYPNFDCPHSVERVGRPGDGGKFVCGVRQIANKVGPCVIYSYGVGRESSFEEELTNRTHCSVYMFDHTIDVYNMSLPKKLPKRVFIEKVGLGVKDTENLRSIKSTMKKYNHDFIDILKIDTEGAEFAVFDNIQDDFPDGLPFAQLLMEIHFPPEGEKNYYKHYLTWLRNLEKMGFRDFFSEINLLGIKWTKSGVPRAADYSFINVKYDNYFLHS